MTRSLIHKRLDAAERALGASLDHAHRICTRPSALL
jgi:hypothetical protein